LRLYEKQAVRQVVPFPSRSQSGTVKMREDRKSNFQRRGINSIHEKDPRESSAFSEGKRARVPGYEGVRKRAKIYWGKRETTYSCRRGPEICKRFIINQRHKAATQGGRME